MSTQYTLRGQFRWFPHPLGHIRFDSIRFDYGSSGVLKGVPLWSTGLQVLAPKKVFREQKYDPLSPHGVLGSFLCTVLKGIEPPRRPHWFASCAFLDWCPWVDSLPMIWVGVLGIVYVLVDIRG